MRMRESKMIAVQNRSMPTAAQRGKESCITICRHGQRFGRFNSVVKSAQAQFMALFFIWQKHNRKYV